MLELYKIKVLAVILLLLLPTTTMAIEGHIAVEYDMMYQGGMVELEIYEEVGNFEIGGQLYSYIISAELKDDWLPSARPDYQFYRGYISYSINNITLTFASQCTHYFSYSQFFTGHTYRNDTAAITAKVKYSFD